MPRSLTRAATTLNTAPTLRAGPCQSVCQASVRSEDARVRDSHRRCITLWRVNCPHPDENCLTTVLDHIEESTKNVIAQREAERKRWEDSNGGWTKNDANALDHYAHDLHQRKLLVVG